jgi:hypothetical protein
MAGLTTAQVIGGLIFLVIYSENLMRKIKKKMRSDHSARFCIFCFFLWMVITYAFHGTIFGVLQLIFQDETSKWILKTIFSPFIILLSWITS